MLFSMRAEPATTSASSSRLLIYVKNRLCGNVFTESPFTPKSDLTAEFIERISYLRIVPSRTCAYYFYICMCVLI